MIAELVTRLPLAPNPAPTSVTVPTGSSLLSGINWGVVGACVLVAIILVAAWKALPKWMIALGVALALIAAGIVSLNPHTVGH